MGKIIFETKNSVALMILRIVLGVVFFVHGSQKVLGWFGGYGFKATIGAFTDKLHIPLVFALLAIAAEFIGSIALIFGFCTRIAAFGIAVVMIVAIFLVHLQYGFFMNWNGMQKGEGIEYHILVLAITVALMIKGAGLFSIDRKISKK